MGAHPPWTDDREHDVALVQSFVDVLPEIDTGWDIVDVAEHRVLSVLVRQPVENAAGDDSRIPPSIGNRDPGWRPFLFPGLEVSKLLERRNVDAVASGDELFNRRTGRQMRQETLRRSCVRGKTPDPPETETARVEPALRTLRRMKCPKLHGHRPGARRVHDQCALARDQPFIIGRVIPGEHAGWKRGDDLLEPRQDLFHLIRLDGDIAFCVDQLRALSREYGADPVDRVTASA